MDDLVKRLHALSRYAHDDRSIGDEAADEIGRLTAERDVAIDALRRNGFVKCDIPACNCGSWHARYGFPERWRELADQLEEAGHPLCNENGNLMLNALRELVAERDALQAKLDALPKMYAELRDEVPDHKSYEGYAEGWIDACNECAWVQEELVT